MPKYKCKDCGAVFYGWATSKVCPKCGGKLELVPENDADKK
jgi:rRNA maturation endonuclease Nob1